MLNIFYKYLYLFITILFFSIFYLKIFFEKVTINPNFYYLFGVFLLLFVDKIIDFFKKDFELLNIKNDKNFFIKVFAFLILIIFLSFFKITIINFLVIIFLLFSIFFKLDSRISFLIALILLAYSFYSLGIGDKKMTEIFSIYAYYFLIIGVSLEIIQNLFNKKYIDEK